VRQTARLKGSGASRHCFLWQNSVADKAELADMALMLPKKQSIHFRGPWERDMSVTNESAFRATRGRIQQMPTWCRKLYRNLLSSQSIGVILPGN
jgi:hypothetical protein